MDDNGKGYDPDTVYDAELVSADFESQVDAGGEPEFLFSAGGYETYEDAYAAALDVMTHQSEGQDSAFLNEAVMNCGIWYNENEEDWQIDYFGDRDLITSG